ncbi:hypothetical protein THIARS_70677 [Thiomonas delicata]|uniref:Uncharacterized protein n=1 Tax=Thiomonas delicata TaxID=364030 RepID=A0A238D6X5_THIDL|nr:hypothetical protein THIARS_70677 [Thiomonas delicata]
MGVSLRQKLRQTTGANKPVNTPFRHDLNQLASTKPGAVQTCLSAAAIRSGGPRRMRRLAQGDGSRP